MPVKKKVVKKKKFRTVPPMSRGGKNKGGRPRNEHTETPEILQAKFDEYMALCESQVFIVEHDRNGRPYERISPQHIPGMGRFGRYIGYTGEGALQELEKYHEEFKPIINNIRESVKRFMVEGGLSNKLNSRFAQYVLSTAYNGKPMIAKTEQTIKQEIKSVSVDLPTEKEAKDMTDAELARRMSDILLGKGK